MVKIGQTLIFDYSDWDSYGFNGPFSVLKDFEPEEVLKDYMMNFKPRLKWSGTYGQ